jgi:signal transduction histidine kinase
MQNVDVKGQTHQGRSPSNDRALALYAIIVLIPLLVVVIVHTSRYGLVSERSPWELLLWTIALVLVNLLEVPTQAGQALVAAEPLAIAMCILFSPPVACLLALAGSCNPHELRSVTDVVRGASNRAQTALGVLLASYAVQPLLAKSDLPHVVAAVVVAWAVLTMENYAAVAIGIAVHQRVPIRVALGRLKTATASDYGITMATWCLLAVGLVLLYRHVSVWALLVVAGPAVVTRQVLARDESLERTHREIEHQRQTIAALSDRIEAERRSERVRIAGDLHDEVVQPLFQLSLLARVTKHDLEGENLDEVAGDLDQIAVTSDVALDRVRETVRGLRASPLGPRGLASALETLVHGLDYVVPLTAQIDHNRPVELSEAEQLAVYQIAREALNNAVHYSRAKSISVTFICEQDAYVLRVEDDGVGFDMTEVAENHFGLRIMEERAASIGASLYIDTALGIGTRVTAIFAYPT